MVSIRIPEAVSSWLAWNHSERISPISGTDIIGKRPVSKNRRFTGRELAGCLSARSKSGEVLPFGSLLRAWSEFPPVIGVATILNVKRGCKLPCNRWNRTPAFRECPLPGICLASPHPAVACQRARAGAEAPVASGPSQAHGRTKRQGQSRPVLAFTGDSARRAAPSDGSLGNPRQICLAMLA